MNFNSQQDQDLRGSERQSDLPKYSISGSSIEKRSERLTVPEIARRLGIGRLAVYDLLEQGLLPGIRLRRGWIITRHAYDQWERTCGMPTAGLPEEPEVTVLN